MITRSAYLHSTDEECEVWEVCPYGIEVKIMPSKIHGTGVFATQLMFPGQVIGLYEGRVDYNAESPHALLCQDEDGEWYALTGTGPLRFMNHSDDPNAEMHGFHVKALKAIDRGDEITIKYDENWEAPEADDDSEE